MHKGQFCVRNGPINGADLVVGCLIERGWSPDNEVAAGCRRKPPPEHKTLPKIAFIRQVC